MRTARSTVELAHGDTAYTIHGQLGAPRSLLVFGGFHFPRNCDRFFAELGGRLGADFCVLTYDYYGRGDSADPGQRYDEALYLDQATQLLAKLELSGPLDLLGYSFGGNVVARFAAAQPERARSLTISGPFGAWAPFLAPARLLPRIGLGWLLDRLYWRMLRGELARGFDDPTTHAAVIEHMLAVELEIRGRDPGKLRRAILGTFRHFPTDTRAKIESLAGRELPILLVSGVRDSVCPIEHIRAMHASLSGSRLVELDANHNDPWLVEPMREQLLTALVEFLR
ncbi:alpha/beta fold hydrolase [Enhygromyxa salina]|uniref:alpha/beta fold hydrolase n=1 Tax=Enhygromyxa salina TaxID=215803 RepID=UPI0015E5EEBE|nr:alpha/beta hydrolase [Enhygromyxa salina]